MVDGPPPPAVVDAAWLVDDLLRVEELLLSTAGASANPFVAEPALHLLKAGGKRLRPALVLTTSHAGEPGRRETDLAAAAVELVHLATLYHDDVIDGTGTRRGATAVHAQWGVEIAVLSGDYLFAQGCALGAEAGGDVPAILANAIGEVCEGQIAETAALGDVDRSTDDYVATIKAKTASLFRAACVLGAATSGADDAARVVLARYGERLGLAFQMVDDLLDLVGDPMVTGKSTGTDLKDGVFTLPVLIACARDDDLAERLRRGERDLDAILPALISTGGLRDAYEVAASHGARATAALDALPDGEWRSALETAVGGVLAQVPNDATSVLTRRPP